MAATKDNPPIKGINPFPSTKTQDAREMPNGASAKGIIGEQGVRPKLPPALSITKMTTDPDPERKGAMHPKPSEHRKGDFVG